jgi:hypothetical protein
MADGKDQPSKWAQTLESLPPEQIKEIVPKIIQFIESKISESLPSAVDEVLQRLGYTSEIAGLVQLIAAKSNEPKEEVLRKALTLYGVALDALEKGNRMAILSPDDVIVHEVGGIGPVESSPRQAAG